MEEITPTFFEQVILKYLYTEKAVREKVIPFLSLTMFDDQSNILLLKNTLNFQKIHNKFPTPSEMKVFLDNTDAFNRLNDIIELDLSEFDDTFILKEIEEYIRKKSIHNTAVDIVENLNEETIDKIMSAPDKIREALAFSFDTKIGLNFLELSPDEIYDMLNDKDRVVSTGLPKFDRMIDGGFHEKSLTLFMAETNMGKSLVMCSLATNSLLQNKNVLYVTLEMSEKKVLERIIANTFNQDISDLKSMSKEFIQEKIAEIKRKVIDKNLIIKEYPTKSISTNTLRNLVKECQVKKNFTPDIIYVDYLGIMNPCHVRDSDNTYTEIGRIAQELRGLSVEFEVSGGVVSGLQTNRKGFNSGELDLTDVADSIGTTTIADIIIGITQPDELREAGRYLWIILKNRYGLNKKKTAVVVDYLKMRVEDVPDEDENGKKEDMVRESLAKPKQIKEKENIQEGEDIVHGVLGRNEEDEPLDFTGIEM